MIIGPKLHAQIFSWSGRELTSIRLKAEWVGPLLGIDPLDVEDSVAPLSRISRRWPTASTTAWGWRAPPPRRGTCCPRSSAICRRRRAPGRRRSRQRRSARAQQRRPRALRARRGDLGLPDRHFRRQIHDRPDSAEGARALRLVGAILTADAAERPAWVDVALASGDCNQSHLIRECVAMAGATPADLHRERRAQVIDAA